MVPLFSFRACLWKKVEIASCFACTGKTLVQSLSLDAAAPALLHAFVVVTLLSVLCVR